MKWLGVAALACYAVHAVYHVSQGSPENMFWACHLGAAMIGCGLIMGARSLTASGTLLLCLGTPQWLLYLAGGGEFLPTSAATHVVALGIGLYAINQNGVPHGVWRGTLVLLIVLIAVSRIITPAHANVNIAHNVQQGWETTFPSYPVYIVVMVAFAGAYFWIIEILMRRLLNNTARIDLEQ